VFQGWWHNPAPVHECFEVVDAENDQPSPKTVEGNLAIVFQFIKLP